MLRKKTHKGFKKPAAYLVRRRRTLRQIGKKGRENQKVNREKKQEHLKSGIVTCELRISPHCTPFDNLTWAHSLKRRHMGKWGSDERAANMRESICACVFCHDLAEIRGEVIMRPIILQAIDNRPNKETEAA